MGPKCILRSPWTQTAWRPVRVRESRVPAQEEGHVEERGEESEELEGEHLDSEASLHGSERVCLLWDTWTHTRIMDGWLHGWTIYIGSVYLMSCNMVNDILTYFTQLEGDPPVYLCNIVKEEGKHRYFDFTVNTLSAEPFLISAALYTICCSSTILLYFITVFIHQFDLIRSRWGSLTIKLLLKLNIQHSLPFFFFF